MKTLIFVFFYLIVLGAEGQTKADRRLKNMETFNYSGLSKESIRYRISQNKSEELSLALKETADTFFVYSIRAIYDDTMSVRLHKLTFDKNGTCSQDISIFLFSQDYEYEANFYTNYCCVVWENTLFPNTYISLSNTQIMTVTKSSTKPFLIITYNYYPKMTKMDYEDFKSGYIINWKN